MKRKILTTAVTAVLGISLLSACGADYKVNFADYWKKSVDTTIIQTVTETCEYDVSFTKGANASYSANYKNGTYKTTFVSETANETTVYRYTTEFSIQVQYSANGKNSEWLNDSVSSTVTFQSSKNALKPISSEKHSVNHSPIAVSASSLESAYAKYDMTIKTDYDATCENGTTTITDNTKTKDNVKKQTFSVKHNKYNYVDNEELLFALRCVNPTANASNRFQVYSPFASVVQIIKATYGTLATADFNFAIGEESSSSKKISYYPVTLQLNAKNNNTGASQTVWIAQTSDAQSNTYRNVMLKYEKPLSFDLGTLVFQLKTATFA